MKKFLLLSCLLIAAWATLTRTEELPHIPGTALQWGMHYKEAHTLLPGEFDGFIILHQQEFAEMKGHPVVGQYTFDAQQRLISVLLTPSYTRKTHPEYWIGEYEHIDAYLTEIYGEPTTQQEEKIIWQLEHTQAQLIMNSVLLDGAEIQTGWIVRFDPIPEKQEEK
jgi:hypothetical protein